MRSLTIVFGAVMALGVGSVEAQEVDAGRARAAVERALPRVQAGLRTFLDAEKPAPPPQLAAALPETYRKLGCISCHHEGMGLTTLSFLGRRGFAVDRELADRQAGTLRRGYDVFAPLYRRALTEEKADQEADFFGDIAAQMGYMLGALLDSGQRPDPSTDAAARLLLKHQEEDGSWTCSLAREPMQSSDFQTTALAGRVLRAYGPDGPTDPAVARARAWLRENSPVTLDDLAFRVLGVKWLGASAGDVAEAVRPLLAAQRTDGGWAQTPNAESSDAYATGLALLALSQGGNIPVTDPAYRRGVAFLLATQRPDGTWFVRKWAHPYNGYFEAGFPYGKSQFISLPATCYAMMALATAAGPEGPARIVEAARPR